MRAEAPVSAEARLLVLALQAEGFVFTRRAGRIEVRPASRLSEGQRTALCRLGREVGRALREDGSIQ